MLSPLDDGTRTKFVQAETFRGVLVGFINRRIGSDVEEGFVQMNGALKRRVENTDDGASREDVQETKPE
ncbi:hypothetical protein [Natrinema sp. 1APR25-10V2]|uniref:hypothetical protein n=1 Tax=Natrinema sp. 1APR25-10V2 TaxID=2951081 RepID=UPI00287B6C4A|nr:hypothetical protein [Natrinema sp. 1APR25-10V2]